MRESTTEWTGVIVDRDRLRLARLERALDQAGVAVVARSTSPAHISALVREHQPDLLVAGIDRGLHDFRRLTKRELEVLGLVAEGRSNPEVARLLWLTEPTVKFHLRNVFRKLDVANRFEASDWAHSHHVRAVRREPLPASGRDRSCPAPAHAPRAAPPSRPHRRSTRHEPSCRAFRTRGL